MSSEKIVETEFQGRPYNFSTMKMERKREDYSRFDDYFRNDIVRAGQQAPDFTLPDLDGNNVTLSDLRGKPVMIEFGSIT